MNQDPAVLQNDTNRIDSDAASAVSDVVVVESDSSDPTANDTTAIVSPSPWQTPPAAPVKLRRRRRPMQLVDRLRSRRRQLLQQHPNNNNIDNNRNNNNSSNGLLRQPRESHSLVENYYRVERAVVPAPPLTTTRLQQSETSAGAEAVAIVPPQGKRVFNVILPGVPKYEEDWARDSHDFFNLVVLLPVIVLNIMNWNWDIMVDKLSKAHSMEALLVAVQTAWTGDWFDVFFTITAAYFVIDMLWILMLPICVKSPSVILQHHVAVLVYILIPFHHHAVRYCMGACMTVEINTWFLIARRVFNKQGFPPWTVFNSSWLSIRVKVISIFFYLTWISIRCLLYPLLLVPFYRHWRHWSLHTGTWCNVLLPSVPLHAAFCLLNLKWSYELLMSKLRYFRRQRQYHQALKRNPHTNGHHQYRRPNTTFSDPSVSSGL